MTTKSGELSPVGTGKRKKTYYKKRWFWMTIFILSSFFLVGGFFVFKTGRMLNVISEKNDSAMGSLFGLVSGKGIEKEEDGRVNVLLMGMRGTGVIGGDFLSDSIMVVSLKPKENKVAMISIPRDLYVEVPGGGYQAKINAVYAYGETGEKKQGLSQAKKIVSEVTGLPIHYSIIINFNGFRQLIDAIGGVEIELETPFYETTQFVKGKECGGQFTLPKGLNVLDGETALCYVRARENTSDFDRAKRQQVVLQSLKDKLISLGTLTDFNKVNGVLNAVGDNVRTDMSSSEIRKFFEEYSSMQSPEVFQRVFENSSEGFLMVPEDAPEKVGYILIPRAGWNNYSQLHDASENIFDLEVQKNIEPIKQYYKPQPITEESSNKKDEDEKTNEEVGYKTVKISYKGDLPVSKDLKVSSVKQEIKKVEMKDFFKDKEFEINLSSFKKEKKLGDFNFRIEDLEELMDSKIDNYKNKDLVIRVNIVKNSYCGDGNLDEDEECDDGNLKNEDGCSDECKNE